MPSAISSERIFEVDRARNTVWNEFWRTGRKDSKSCGRELDLLVQALCETYIADVELDVACAILNSCAKYEGKPLRYKRVQKAIDSAVQSVSSDIIVYHGYCCHTISIAHKADSCWERQICVGRYDHELHESVFCTASVRRAGMIASPTGLTYENVRDLAPKWSERRDDFIKDFDVRDFAAIFDTEGTN